MIKFGDRVSITEKLERRVRVRPNGNYKVWLPVPINADDCIFLGYRTLTNGQCIYDPDDGYYYKADDKLKVALVCIRQNLNPIYVPIDSLGG